MELPPVLPVSCSKNARAVKRIRLIRKKRPEGTFRESGKGKLDRSLTRNGDYLVLFPSPLPTGVIS